MARATLPHPCHGWDAVALYRGLTLAQLGELRAAVEADPGHASGSIWLYKPSARRKLDAISWAVTYHLQDLKQRPDGPDAS
jgi:hypothetical protein